LLAFACTTYVGIQHLQSADLRPADAIRWCESNPPLPACAPGTPVLHLKTRKPHLHMQVRHLNTRKPHLHMRVCQT